MSQGGAFQVQTAEGKIDAILVATKYLNFRLKQRRALRRKAGLKGVSSIRTTLNYVEKSHVVPVTTHFKPFITMGQVYNVISATNQSFGSLVEFNLDQTGTFISDIAADVVISPMGTAAAVGSTTAPYYRYTRKPGIALFPYVEILLTGDSMKPVDSYTSDNVLGQYDKFMSGDRVLPWNRCIGQEDTQEAYAYNAAKQVTQVFPVRCGPQTLKQYQPELPMMIPILFEFCLRPEKAFPSIMVTPNLRKVRVQLTDMAKMVAAYSYDVTTNTFTSLPTPVVNITRLNLYVNNLYVSDEIADIYKENITFVMTRLHKTQSREITVGTDAVLMNGFVNALETICIGFQPLTNASSFDTWDLWGRVDTSVNVCVPMLQPQIPPIVLPGAPQLVAQTATLTQSLPNISNIGMRTAGDIYLIPANTPIQLLHSYIPQKYVYDTCTVAQSTVDLGVMMFNWRQHPDSLQQDGYVQMSRNREARLEYSSTFISPATPAICKIVGTCINFVVFTDGQAVNRYTT